MNQHGRINKNTEIKIVALEVTKYCQHALFVCHIETDNRNVTIIAMEFSRTKLCALGNREIRKISFV